MCKTIVDRLINSPLHADPKRKSFWIHAAGGMGVERASNIALHLCNRFYPGQLQMFTYTAALNSEEEVRIISMVSRNFRLLTNLFFSHKVHPCYQRGSSNGENVRGPKAHCSYSRHGGRGFFIGAIVYHSTELSIQWSQYCPRCMNIFYLEFHQ